MTYKKKEEGRRKKEEGRRKKEKYSVAYLRDELVWEVWEALHICALELYSIFK
ncbi:MAG: hypothetical protein F6K25_07165 [Okeania sp. SIO2G4]|uniref:hypothetical protein n=1 Tax=unclassified Okeania TaxID=2634635 RepID=UPI0013B8116C|nr:MULTISPECIES: hypothetical protein [unclassified Okeania]NEP05527.1 hypothetical protein [Okeania sp. SIO4D6]NEP72228.1 hypothetical protein [Okeania sp. SIO2G5]NEP92254.1 hypothetical protein [Okeania sp. SIO2F5]NEQ90508.1 hypothetical protein [Okeania sp. SIO2G4]